MREICLVRLDKTRPALVLTREAARGAMTKVTVALITSTIKGLSSEVRVGTENGLNHECVVSLDNVLTVQVVTLERRAGISAPTRKRCWRAPWCWRLTSRFHCSHDRGRVTRWRCGG